MREILLFDGYMLCVMCKGFIDAGIDPVCECVEDETHHQEEPSQSNLIQVQ